MSTLVAQRVCWGSALILGATLLLTSCGGAGGGTMAANPTITTLGGPPTVDSPAPLTFTSITAGGNDHSCGTTTDGKTYCWGDNWFGQLGVASVPSGQTNKPVEVSGGLTFQTVVAGLYHTCGLTASGSAYCWGRNDTGQLGDGTSENRSSPTAVKGGLFFAMLTVGDAYTCGLTSAGDAYCWGLNFYGQLGNGVTTRPDLTPNPLPLAVGGGLTFTALDAGGGNTCGITDAGDAYCWGSNYTGAVGLGYQSHDEPNPQPVVGGLKFQQIGVGGYHSCGLTLAQEIYCWGGNWYGQMGDPALEPETVFSIFSPNPAPLGVSLKTLRVGGGFNCGLNAEGFAFCWGVDTDNAVLGNKADRTCYGIPCSTKPLAVTGGIAFVELSSGPGHSCGLTSSGEGYCWGWDQAGSLGGGTTGSNMTPVKIMRP